MSYIDEFTVQGKGEKAPGAETRPHAHIQADRIWVVFARRAYDQPLAQVGTVEADDPERWPASTPAVSTTSSPGWRWR